MTRNQPAHVQILRTISKFFVSFFVVCTFIAYALHERLSGASAAANNVPPAPGPSPIVTSPQVLPTQPPLVRVPAAPTTAPRPPAAPTATPVPRVAGQYRDGSYTGPAVNAFWGDVQVRAVVQNGRLADVQFLNYPSDRRTSQRINNFALPELRTEVIQAQNTDVDLISGATLTSDAFLQSLDSALASARSN